MERISFQDAAGVYNALKQGQNYIDQCGLDLKLLELMRMRVVLSF